MMTEREKLQEFLEAQPDFNNVLRKDILDTFDRLGLITTLHVWKLTVAFENYFEWD